MLLQLMKVVLKKTHLSELDRILGAVLGAIKGVIAVSLAVLACSFSDLPKQDDWKHAVTAPMFESLAMLAKPYLPKFLADQVSFEHEKSTQPSNDKIPQSKSQSNISNSLFYPQNIKATVPLPFWGSRGVGFYSAVRDVQMATKNVFSSSI